MKTITIFIGLLILTGVQLFAQLSNHDVSSASVTTVDASMAGVSGAQTVPDALVIDKNEIIRMVIKELPSWLGKIPPGYEKEYGFLTRDDFEKVIPGDLFLVYTLDNKFFANAIRADSNYLRFSGDIRVPVLIDEEYRALITVSMRDGKWKIVDYGAVNLAKELQQNISAASDKVASFKVLRIYQLTSDFLFQADPGSPSSSIILFPLHSANLNLPEISSFPAGSLKLAQLQLLVKSKIPAQSELYENK